jgi:hypothetical protein
MKTLLPSNLTKNVVTGTTIPSYLQLPSYNRNATLYHMTEEDARGARRQDAFFLVGVFLTH